MILRLAAIVAALAAPALSVSASFGADITVGFVTSLSGPGASIGIPYEKGILAGYAYADKVGDHKIKLIRLDDASDPVRSDPQRPQACRRRKGRCVDGHVRRSRHNCDGGRRHRDQDANHFAHTCQPAAKPERPVAHFHSTAAAPDGRRGGRAHEKGQRQEGRLHRIQRLLGRSRL